MHKIMLNKAQKNTMAVDSFLMFVSFWPLESLVVGKSILFKACKISLLDLFFFLLDKNKHERVKVLLKETLQHSIK